ncbi:hypothetical protein AWZ03_011001 [Drosophila navojoa]|uniref:Uncharacterized protein n=1 Tax=Drosophila navojoa TaxID=7232 RepID=A0A484B2U5_DRONA|nr:hypothetical protein AWZ03_011001 [Drosophila navojoa]
MKGWFDAFRDDGGPTLYSFSNRTPVTGDVSIVAVSVLFATFYVAFLVIFPGVRKQKFTTFSTVTLSLFVGLVILITRLGSAWHVAHATIIAPYKAFSREKLPARIGTHIGLMHVNVTLTADAKRKINDVQPTAAAAAAAAAASASASASSRICRKLQQLSNFHSRF